MEAPEQVQNHYEIAISYCNFAVLSFNFDKCKRCYISVGVAAYEIASKIAAASSFDCINAGGKEFVAKSEIVVAAAASSFDCINTAAEELVVVAAASPIDCVNAAAEEFVSSFDCINAAAGKEFVVKSGNWLPSLGPWCLPLSFETPIAVLFEIDWSP
nr:hypothetical protein Iba_chr09aCG11610 [Ipomoea batatas]